MCGFIAQLVEHRTGIAEVTGSNLVEALIFFRLLLSNCLNWKIYCDDHSSLLIYILIIKVKKLFSFFSLRCFLKRNRKHVLIIQTLVNVSVGELEKAVETLACGSRSHSISRSPKLLLVLLKLDRNTVHVFYFLNKQQYTVYNKLLNISTQKHF